jgi:glycosyltransferase involved in cell wall biosynthesis
MSKTTLSVIIPARNEAALISRTLDAVLMAAAHVPQLTEILVVDNQSSDQTAAIVATYAEHGVRLLACDILTAPAARNLGACHATGSILVFVDADTLMPPDGLLRIVAHCERLGFAAGLSRLVSLEGGRRAWLWWTFWEHVRRLPLAYAKAMPALMFCTRDVFERFGPFDEAVRIGEEWTILAGLYRSHPRHLVYDRDLIAQTSSRRMDLQPFGYSRTFLKYVWAILHRSGRIHYTDQLRHTTQREVG